MVKLINFFDIQELNHLRYQMNASEAKRFKANSEITLLDEESIRRLGQEGIDVSIEEIKTLSDKTLSYRGQRVIVYIRDISKFRDDYKLPKFHISFCRTLEQMTNNNRWGKYVVANRDDGYFQICINNSEYKSEQLDVCQSCLDQLSWAGFSISGMRKSERVNIVRDFSINEFFIQYPKSLFSITPKHTSDSAPANAYTSDWPIVSENLKMERGYKCESTACGIVLSGNDKKYLHVHHKNGQKNINSSSNLEVLCISCHAEEHAHSHMKSRSDYKEFISRYKS